MKLLAILLLIAAVSACSNNSATVKQAADNSSSESQNQVTGAQGNDILGEWELVLVTEDKNGNYKLDDEERKNGITTMKDNMKLAQDGSCYLYPFKDKGRYEIETKSGKKYLTLYDAANGKHRKGEILSVSKDELIIMNKFGGDSFTVWKRM